MRTLNFYFPNRECPPIVTGIVGPESSSNTLLAAHSANLALTPIISYFATSLELQDQTMFPTLFTTVPSDDHQVSTKKALQGMNNEGRYGTYRNEMMVRSAMVVAPKLVKRDPNLSLMNISRPKPETSKKCFLRV